jgi:hypothetical protein
MIISKQNRHYLKIFIEALMSCLVLKLDPSHDYYNDLINNKLGT